MDYGYNKCVNNIYAITQNKNIRKRGERMIVTINRTLVEKKMFAKGFYLNDLSREANVGVSYLSQILNGKKRPSPKLAKRIAETLEVEIEELFIFDESVVN